MTIRLVHHLNIATTQLEATRDFYVDVLGLTEGARPPFSSKGYWLYAGDVPVVHMQVSPIPVTGTAASALNHAAFLVEDMDLLLARLDAHGVPYRLTKVPGTEIRQAFFLDPNGVQLEFNAS